MDVATGPKNDRSWINNMQVNNEPINYDFGVEDDIHEDGDEPEEIPLDDDLCNAQMKARSMGKSSIQW